MSRLPLEPIGRPLRDSTKETDIHENRSSNAERTALLETRREAVRLAADARGRARVAALGKRTAWERVQRLADPDTAVVPVGTFVGWPGTGPEEGPCGAGVHTCFCRVQGRWVAVVANDNLVSAGAWWPGTPEKIQRIQQIALRLHLPVAYLVESSGLYLPYQARTFGGAHGAGGIFRLNARLAAAGVPQVAGVFGPCIAGGGYMPIISDHVVMTEQSYMVIGGASLVRGAKAGRTARQGLGGPDVHVHQSGCADERVPDDDTCIEVLRTHIGLLPTSAVPWFRKGAEPLPPSFPAAEIGSLVPPDHRKPYDIRQVLARLLDASLFHEVLPHVGQEVVLGVGRIGGLWVGIVANEVGTFPHPRQPDLLRSGGVLYREGVARISTFVRACDEDGIPLVWLQDVAGFDIGEDAEAEGLLGFGSSLIYSNSTIQVPSITVLLRRASGAGYYAQAGRPYDPVLLLATPLTRLGVMEGRTLAAAASAHEQEDAARPPVHDSEARDREQRRLDQLAARIEADMDPWRAAGRGDVDEIVSLAELRPTLEAAVEMCYQATGTRRIRNPRIWSIHDLEVACSSP